MHKIVFDQTGYTFFVLFNHYKNVNCFSGSYKIEELIRLVNINVSIASPIAKGEDHEIRYCVRLLHHNLYNFSSSAFVTKKVRFLDSVPGLM